MTYSLDDSSVSDGAPIELYDFSVGLLHYRYTSGPDEVTYALQTYSPEAMERDDIELSENAFKNELDIKIDRENLFFRRFINSPVDGIVSLTVYRGHGSNFVTYWVGVVAQVVFDSNEISVTCTPKTSSLIRTGLRRKVQKLCNYPLYSVGCTVNAESFKSTGTVLTVDGNTMTATVFGTKADGWFIAGKFVLGTAKRLITSHVGTTITLSRAIQEAGVGNAFSAFRGCDHSMTTCRTAFDNLVNYGGQPWLPTKNPFVGDGIA